MLPDVIILIIMKRNDYNSNSDHINIILLDFLSRVLVGLSTSFSRLLSTSSFSVI